MFEAFFRCSVCQATIAVEVDRGKIAEPTVCRQCNTLHSMQIIHNRCKFTDKQMMKLQELPGMLSLVSKNLHINFDRRLRIDIYILLICTQIICPQDRHLIPLLYMFIMILLTVCNRVIGKFM